MRRLVSEVFASPARLDTAKIAPKQQPGDESLRIRAGLLYALCRCMQGIEERIVYILRSNADPSRHYVGITTNVLDRLKWHNHGPSGHTVDHRPWSLVVSLEFPTGKAGVSFETYLKSGSGRAFAKRHFSAAHGC